MLFYKKYQSVLNIKPTLLIVLIILPELFNFFRRLCTCVSIVRDSTSSFILKIILFIMMDIAKISLGQMVRAVIPFYIPLIITLMVVTYWEGFVLFIPRLFGKV